MWLTILICFNRNSMPSIRSCNC
ncbi:UNVERIFIED_CONTAM: hypothetical protein GTU68_048379 [Idotea baltica]|nr:hypothetical protein [Idotea baltica]